MVKISSIALFLIASAVSVQACSYCSCLYRGGQECCVTPDQVNWDTKTDCHAECLGKNRQDGTKLGSPCNGGGAWKCITQSQMESRVKCVNPPRNTAAPGYSGIDTPIPPSWGKHGAE
ncbi:hypothetical protein NHQ30_006331 [Ciborinia camelliae]|nr:hypothetical protein NHQ30_006331 [Ciborinia camelliae]